MRNLLALGATVAATLALGVACTVHQTPTPPLTGPSELSTAVHITATPDSISQDGASQSSIVISVFDANGKPLVGLALRLDIAVNGTIEDFGTLSTKSVVTGNDGKAFAIYTAPATSPAATGSSGLHVTIIATPIGSNASVSESQSVDIRLVPPGVILPPADTPTPKFTFSPTSPTANLSVLFDASSSCAGSTACTSTAGITNFSWSFGDGGTSTGQTTTHTYRLNGTFNATLTVTNQSGVQASTTSQVTVGTGTKPSADFVFSPTTPVVSQAVNFDASQAQAAPGHSISSYVWSWGDATPNSTGVTTSHTFTAAGTFNVILSVTDEAGQTTTNTKPVTVGAGNPTAQFSSVETNTAQHLVSFDASASTAAQGSTITNYHWAFGDGGTQDTANPQTTYKYLTGPYPLTVTVILTVTDSATPHRTASAQQTITVQ